MPDIKKFAIILAGGEGHRFGGSTPKQFAPLKGRTVLWWAMKRFLNEDPDTSIIVVMHPGMFDDFDIMMDSLPEEDRIPNILCCGGRSRSESVANGLIAVRDLLSESGLSEIPSDCIVAIHDAARPLVSETLIRRGWTMAVPGTGAIPVVKPVASLRKIKTEEDNKALFYDSDSMPVDRSEYAEVQTPQFFTAKDIFDAYIPPLPDNMTDDASLAQLKGVKIILFEGEYTNIKITNPLDSIIAEAIINSFEYERFAR